MVDLGCLDGSARHWLTLGLLLSSAGCGDFLEFDSGATESQVRLIDRCEQGGCNTSGAAEMTTGITADSVGFVLGPGQSSLVIQLDTTDDWAHKELLLRGEGVYFDGVQGEGTGRLASQEAPKDFEWRSFSADSDRSITISTADSSSRIEVADARYDEYSSIHCSMGAPGARSKSSLGAGLVFLLVAVPLGARRLVRGRIRLKPAAG